MPELGKPKRFSHAAAHATTTLAVKQFCTEIRKLSFRLYGWCQSLELRPATPSSRMERRGTSAVHHHRKSQDGYHPFHEQSLIAWRYMKQSPQSATGACAAPLYELGFSKNLAESQCNAPHTRDLCQKMWNLQSYSIYSVSKSPAEMREDSPVHTDC